MIELIRVFRECLIRNAEAIRSLGVVITLAAIAVPVAGSAEVRARQKSDIRLQGRSESVVTEPTVRLGDLALIESAAVADDERIIELRKISIAESPKAGETTTIEGVAILDKLRDAGVQLDSLRYTFPRQIKVTRAYREVSLDELEDALKSFIQIQDRKIEVKHLLAERPVRIPADALGVEVVGLQAVQPGHYGVDYRSRASSGDVRFQMKAMADEWRIMPTAAKPLKRGEPIHAGDVRLARVSGASLSSDSLEQIGDVVGRVLLRDVGQGEIFSSKIVKVPPVIEVGSPVTMIYRRGRLEATARGVALEDGVEGQEISIRNEASKKVLRARVQERGVVIVGVQQQ
jgi:flagella basal body P-ring formation protein FlgA